MKKPIWTSEEENILRELAPTMFADEVAALLGRTVNAVRKRAVDKHIRFRTAEKKCSHQPCWECRWAVNPEGNPCAWSARFKPVAGWDAEPTLIAAQGVHSRPVPSYRIKSCPLWERG